MSQRFEIHIASEPRSGWTAYRAELWFKPFSGYMVASTRWCRTRTWARRYAHVFLVNAKP